jgi:uncharacterized protein YdhG (YjbR/CyaY superfamily)
MTRKPPPAISRLYRELPPPQRRTMLAMRERILAIVPEAEEVVSYGMPAFRVNGVIVAGIKGAKNHVGYYPFSGSTLSGFSRELRELSTTKSAIHVPIGAPLSRALLKKLLSARLSQCPVTQRTTDMSKYAPKEGHWKRLGLAAPARRGLIDCGLYSLQDLRRLTRSEFRNIHGVGSRAEGVVWTAMKRAGITFKSGR